MSADPTPYDLLNVDLEATEAQIRTAYRQRSLKVHPDRNPNNKEAAAKFHELNQAYELLLDPLRRLALDAKLRVQKAREERFRGYDKKRKNLVQELEEREREFKKARVDRQKEEVAAFQENERIKDEGRRLREEKEKELMQKMKGVSEAATLSEDDEEAPPPLDPHDTTVKVTYSLDKLPQLDHDELVSRLSQFGSIDNDLIVVTKNTKKKTGSALVPFKRIADAYAAVCNSGRSDRNLKDIKIRWLGKQEPQILGWLKKMGKLGTATPAAATPRNQEGVKAALPQMQSTSDSSSFSSFPSSFPNLSPVRDETKTSIAPGLDYESLTLLKMREAERARLEREILEQEANEQ